MKTDSLEVQRLKHTIRYLKSEIRLLLKELREQKKLNDGEIQGINAIKERHGIK